MRKDSFIIDTTHSDTITTKLWDDLQRFVEEELAISPNDPAIENMLIDNESGLLFNIKTKSRWTKDIGAIHILQKDNKIIGISAVEYSTLHKRLCIGGIRCWLNSKFRNEKLVTSHLLDFDLDWGRFKNMWAMMLTFNGYNKTIYNGIKRKSLGKSAGIGKIWSNWWNDCMIIDKPLLIRNVEQWCVLKPINLFGCKLIQYELQRES